MCAVCLVWSLGSGVWNLVSGITPLLLYLVVVPHSGYISQLAPFHLPSPPTNLVPCTQARHRPIAGRELSTPSPLSAIILRVYSYQRSFLYPVSFAAAAALLLLLLLLLLLECICWRFIWEDIDRSREEGDCDFRKQGLLVAGEKRSTTTKWGVVIPRVWEHQESAPLTMSSPRQLRPRKCTSR